MIHSFFYSIKQGFLQIFRNRGMSVASVFSIIAMLLILGLFFVIMVNLNLFTEVVKQDYDQIEVFLLDDTSESETRTLMSQIASQEGVEQVTYRTEDEALEIMKERWGDNGYLLDSLGENPLPASILIDVDTLENASIVAGYVSTLDGVEDVQFYQETVDTLTQVTDFIQLAALIVMAVLVVISVVVVSNTVKLTVFARSKEIEIMKYIGATNWFIRGPFLAEGVLLGAVASLIATGIIAFAYDRIVDLIGAQVMTIVGSPLISGNYMTWNLVLIFLTLGMSIGAWGSIISMRRFLDT